MQRLKNWRALFHKFEALGIEYFYTLIDDAVARVIRSKGGFIWACKNRAAAFRCITACPSSNTAHIRRYMLRGKGRPVCAGIKFDSGGALFLCRAVASGGQLCYNQQGGPDGPAEFQPKGSITMTFAEMPYHRPDLAAMKAEYDAITARLRDAADYETARAAFLDNDTLERHIATQATLASVRHSIDTRDEFYNAEQKFWDAADPELQTCRDAFTAALLASPFRAEFAAEYGELMFTNAEITRKAFSPAIVADMQRENELTQEYEKLLASAQIPFEGGVYTLSQLEPFKTDADDARRLAAWKAEGTWFKQNQPRMDAIYDELVHLRDGMGKKLGYEGYTTLGYYRMQRNCYTKADIEKFRAAVVKYLVPLADRIRRAQAERLGVAYPLSYADEALMFRTGNPRPVGSADDILAMGQKFYDELSPETSAFFRTMMDGKLLDVLSTPGKASGGYCTSLPDYNVPFIFANFNGTQGDVEVVTHEAGHAFAAWMNRDRVPMQYTWPTMEACECHSMSMEFFAWPWAEGFFGADAAKFRYSHLAGALTFIPYGTAVDHFQHIAYEKPDLTPAQRHAEWKRLLGIYMPWLRLDGDIPFYGDGESWQQKHHIYSSPFYYIDYCLAQTVSLEFWAMIQQDRQNAWDHYMAYTRQGGTKVFTELLKNAGLESPFGENCLRTVCEAAGNWLDNFDLSALH